MIDSCIYTVDPDLAAKGVYIYVCPVYQFEI